MPRSKQAISHTSKGQNDVYLAPFKGNNILQVLSEVDTEYRERNTNWQNYNDTTE